LRYGETSDDCSASLLEGIQKQDTERQMLLRELNASRSRLNFLQRSLSSSNEKERVKMEAKELKQQTIPASAQKLIQITKELEKSLPRVANCVVTLDVEQLSESKHAKKSSVTRKCDEFVTNPLYCLCGYETIAGVTILTGTGAALAHSLSNYALQFLRQDQTFGSFSSAILPESVSVESCIAHSVMGCLPSACPICECTDSKIIAPSFVAALLLHQDKTYWDRQLPVGHVVTTTSSAFPLDKRELARVNSFKRGKTKLWFQQTSGERVEVMTLTGNTLGESIAMQLRMANIIVDFYKSLLVSNSDEPHTIIRTVAPPQLLPCEASRVLIAGVVEKKLVTLGYVSNMTDFSTRGVKTKIGGSLGFCHVVHGVVCSIPETLDWMLAQNVTQDTNELGIATPSQLSVSLQEQIGMTPLDGVLFLPFYRRVHHGKNGKVTRTELNSVSKPRIIQAGDRLETNPIDMSKPRKASFVREGPITAQDIADERMSCPFSFLPIGRKSEF
jgi:seryl-tRNA synthetase